MQTSSITLKVSVSTEEGEKRLIETGEDAAIEAIRDRLRKILPSDAMTAGDEKKSEIFSAPELPKRTRRQQSRADHLKLKRAIEQWNATPVEPQNFQQGPSVEWSMEAPITEAETEQILADQERYFEGLALPVRGERCGDPVLMPNRASDEIPGSTGRGPEKATASTVDEIPGSTLTAEKQRAEPSSSGETRDVEASGELPPTLCNTGGMNRQKPETGGIDTIHLAVFGGWEATAFTKLSLELDDHQERAQAASDSVSIFEAPEGDRLLVQPSGAKMGMYFRWVVEADGCRVYILNRQLESESAPAIFIQIGSVALMSRPLRTIWESLLSILSSLGFTLTTHTISRVDPCIDLPGRTMSEVRDLINAGNEITKAKHARIEAGALIEDWETFYRGNGQRVLMRIYDKLEEVKSDPIKEAILIEKRWGGKRPESAIRVEFQVAREVLKERFNIDTIDDLENALPQLTEWLTSDWYRLAEVPVDRTNRNHARAGTSEFWKVVQQAFKWVGINTIPSIVPRKVYAGRTEQLTKQMLGLCKTILAMGGDELASGAEVVELLDRQIFEYRLAILEGAKRRREILGIKFGSVLEPAGNLAF